MAPTPSTLISSGSKKKEPSCICRSEAKASHSHKMCIEFFSLAPHFLQVGLSLSPITCRFLTRLIYVTRRKCQILWVSSLASEYEAISTLRMSPSCSWRFYFYKFSTFDLKFLTISCEWLCHSNCNLHLSSFNKDKNVTLIIYGNLQIPVCLNKSFSFPSIVVLFYSWSRKLHKSAHKNPLIENVPSHANTQVNEPPLTSLLYF